MPPSLPGMVVLLLATGKGRGRRKKRVTEAYNDQIATEPTKLKTLQQKHESYFALAKNHTLLPTENQNQKIKAEKQNILKVRGIIQCFPS